MRFESDWIAFAVCSIIVVIWLKITQLLTDNNFCSSATARKLVHIATGPLYILCWNIFPDTPNSPYIASIIPGLTVTRFSLIGLGLIKDDSTVKSMSRSGNKSELLYGPLFYGWIMVLSTIFYWGHSPFGITALMLLCAGDGFAGLIGFKYGREKLPWNNKKSWIGSISFFVSSILFTGLYVHLFHILGWFSISLWQFLPCLLITTFVSTIVESLPGQSDWDNISVFLVSLVTMHLLN